MQSRKVSAQQMLEWARAIVVREQDVAARERELAQKRAELDAKQRELTARKLDLEQLQFKFAELAGASDAIGEPAPDAPPAQATAFAAAPRPPLARTTGTIAQRILVVLDMEPRAFSPTELHGVLEQAPPIETLRTTLWKLAQRNLIARPFAGHYCACQHEDAILRAASHVG